MRLIIVDDSEILIDRLTILLSNLNNLEIVGTAQNSLFGEKLIGELNPDIVISDIHMPGGGGFELLEKVKEKYPNVMVCIYSNFPYEEYRKKAMSLGADYFFYKTDESDKLYDTLKEILNKENEPMST